MLLIAIFAAFVLVPCLAMLALAALIIRPVRDCPACFAATLPVRQSWLRPLARNYEWRWCPACGWQAIARRTQAE